MKHVWEEVHAGAAHSLEWCKNCGSLRDVDYESDNKVIHTPKNQPKPCKGE